MTCFPSSVPLLMPFLLACHQVPPASAKQHGVSLSSPTTPFQQASGYGQHSYSAGEGCFRHGEAQEGQAHLAHTCLLSLAVLGYDDVSQGAAAGDYTKGGYGGSSQAQSKSAGSGPGKGRPFQDCGPEQSSPPLTPSQARLPQRAPGAGGGWRWGQLTWEQPLFLLGVSASSSGPGLPDVTGSVYSKTQVREGRHWREGWQSAAKRASLSSLCLADFRQAGIPRRDPTTVQPALGLGLPWAPGPWLRALTARARPARPPAASLTAAAPPPPAGRSGEPGGAGGHPALGWGLHCSLDSLLSSSEWLRSAQPAQLPAAQVASLQTCLRQLSILDKLNPEELGGQGGAYPGQESAHRARHPPQSF